MRRRSPPLLAALLPALLEGCYLNCGAYDGEATASGVVDADLVEGQLDPYGELTARGCDVICRAADLSSVKSVDEVRGCELEVDTGGRYGPGPGEVGVVCSVSGQVYPTCKGRSHASIRHPLPDPDGVPTTVDAWLAQAAWNEAASVGAFRRVARELERHGAPPELVRRAIDAARDEIRHARAMRRLVPGPHPSPQFDAVASRSLFEVALENAVEGCVRETYAALVARHQAAYADADLRPLFAGIADDETRHAQWSWDFDAWVRTALTPRERRQVTAARRRAAGALAEQVEHPPLEVRRRLGLPGTPAARRLAAAFARETC